MNKSMKILFIFTIFISIKISYAANVDKSREIKVNARETLSELLKEEDTDSDKKITVEDNYKGNDIGDEKFIIKDINSSEFMVSGTYYLSNLLQELKLKEKDDKARIPTQIIFEKPLHRISRMIDTYYWDGLTRRIDEENIVNIFKDTKTKTIDGCNYIYVPPSDKKAYRYFKNVSANHPSLRIKVKKLPEKITAEYVENLKGRHGIITLKLRKNSEGNLEGVPYVVPGGRFNEMYGWDSYFESLGLLIDGRGDLAKAMVENFIYEINHYGKILNANRSYYLTRSQPPFLTSMARRVYEQMPENLESKKWLKKALAAAVKEYHNVWMSRPRLTETGLSRYYGEGIGQPPEVEEGHFDAVYRKFAEKYGMGIEELKKAYNKGKGDYPEMDEFFTHDRSMRESGHDKTYRWDDKCADFVTVDLNCLLYKYERDIAEIIKNEFDGELEINSEVHQSADWFKKAWKRKKLINKYLWDEREGLFLDYNFRTENRKIYITPVSLYPLWAELATEEQAEQIVSKVIPALEMPGGLAASSIKSRGVISEGRPQRQWDYPFGWAPHQMIAWEGLANYGFDNISKRLVYRWVFAITFNAVRYNGTVPEKYNVVERSHKVFAEYGNVGTEFDYITKEGFGWMNASFKLGLEILSEKQKGQINKLIPPEWICK